MFGFQFVGETNSNSKLEGKGIKYNADTQIGYFINNNDAPGKYVKICGAGDIYVGEITQTSSRELTYEGIRYKKDGAR